MTSHNDITGDKIQTKVTTEEYRDGWDRIFKHPIFKKCMENTQQTKEQVAFDILSKEVPCCGGSTSCTALCVKEKEND
jgi:hypothetical protein